MATNLKTTVQIPGSLLEEVRKLAAREKTTFKALVEEGLRLIIAKRKRSSRFRLRKTSFKGAGLQSDMVGSSWEQIREKIYKERGG